MANLRVAAVSFLNTAPLVWGMLHGPQKGIFDVEFCVPSECADRLRAGTSDIGIVPVVEVARQGLEVLPGTGIACHGAVRSILLISKVPFSEIRTLAADTSSRTSVVLSQIILSKKYNVEPRYIPMAPDMDTMLAAADACLIIGDPALRIDPSTLTHRYLDLGSEWFDLTGLPMVFAVWAGRAEKLEPGLAQTFIDSCRYGIEHMDEIVAAESVPRGYTPEVVREYLTRYIVSELTDRDYDGMKLFLNYAVELEQVPA